MTGVILVAALSLAQAGDLDERLKNLIGPLGSEKPETRENARAELGKLVARNRKLLRTLMRDHLEHQKDLEVRAALIQAIDRTFSLDDVSLELRFPKDALTVREACSSNTRFKLRLRNNDVDDELVLIRDLHLEVVQPDGKPLETSTFIGAGTRPSGCFLAGAATFLTIPSVHVLEWEECLSGYGSEMRVFKGFEPPRPGTYLLRLIYSFDRPTFRQRCPDNCASHALPDKPWNRALEGKRTFEFKLQVREETAEEQAASARHEKWMTDLMDQFRGGKIDLSGLIDAIDKAKLDQKDRQRVLGVTRESRK